ncbi:MAG: glycosyltransferase, partial [Cyanobacteria bacterium P01_G01_bin.19]
KIMSLISIIIPAYNASDTISKTVNSVLNQTYQNWELIIINDGSTDNTFDLVNQLTDPRIKAHDYPNAGVAEARNQGIKIARGDYLAFLDADDWWTEDKLALQIQALVDNPQAGVAYSWTYFIHEQTEKCFPSKAVYHQGNVLSQLLENNFLAHGSNPLIRRQAIAQTGCFDSSFPHCADWDYYLRLAMNWDFVVVPKHQIYYRQSANSMTAKIAAIEQQLILMLEKTYCRLSEIEQLQKNKSLAWIYRYCTQQYLEYGKDFSSIRDAISYLFKALQYYPPIISEKYTQDLIKWTIKKSIITVQTKYALSTTTSN